MIWFRARIALGRLAVQMMRERTLDVTAERAARILSDGSLPKELLVSAQELLDASSASGLMTVRAHGFAFTHREFQEHLAAWYIVYHEHQDQAAITARFEHDPWWHESLTHIAEAAIDPDEGY